jgi:hypothetical protein
MPREGTARRAARADARSGCSTQRGRSRGEKEHAQPAAFGECQRAVSAASGGSGQPCCDRANELPHLANHQSGRICLALGGLAIGRFELPLEPSRLGTGRNQEDVVVFGLLQSMLVLVLAAGELGCRGLAQAGAQFHERDE